MGGVFDQPLSSDHGRARFPGKTTKWSSEGFIADLALGGMVVAVKLSTSPIWKSPRGVMGGRTPTPTQWRDVVRRGYEIAKALAGLDARPSS